MLSQSSAPAAATAIRPEITTPDSVATDQKAGGSSPSERAQLTGPSQTKMSFLALDSSVFEGSSQLIRPSNVRRRRRPVSKRICLFSVRSMARLVRFGCIRDADELPDRNAESDDRDHQSSQADPVPRLHLHRLLSRDLREGAHTAPEAAVAMRRISVVTSQDAPSASAGRRNRSVYVPDHGYSRLWSWSGDRFCVSSAPVAGEPLWPGDSCRGGALVRPGVRGRCCQGPSGPQPPSQLANHRDSRPGASPRRCDRPAGDLHRPRGNLAADAAESPASVLATAPGSSFATAEDWSRIGKAAPSPRHQPREYRRGYDCLGLAAMAPGTV